MSTRWGEQGTVWGTGERLLGRSRLPTRGAGHLKGYDWESDRFNKEMTADAHALVALSATLPGCRARDPAVEEPVEQHPRQLAVTSASGKDLASF